MELAELPEAEAVAVVRVGVDLAGLMRVVALVAHMVVAVALEDKK